jgi:hypothetical protein
MLCGLSCLVIRAHHMPINPKLKGQKKALLGVEYQGLLIDWHHNPSWLIWRLWDTW